MSESHRRRLMDRSGRSLSLLVDGSRVLGDVEVPGALAVDGEVVGDGNIGAELSIGPSAHWQGEVRAGSAVIAGRLTGGIRVRERIEIGARAVIRGYVSARQIAMARGAIVDGEVTVTGGEPILEFDERREAAPVAESGGATGSDDGAAATGGGVSAGATGGGKRDERA